MRLDFAGSGPVHPGNLNAPFAVVRAAVIYALRVVAGEDIPLNEGVLDRVDLMRCPGLLDPPFTGDATTDPAVAIGNTETSQRVVDALLRVFEAGACSQGTMNNLLLGDDNFGYYETICGGASTQVPSIQRTKEREHSTSPLTIFERNLFTSASCGETSTSGAERMAPTRSRIRARSTSSAPSPTLARQDAS